MNYYIFRGDSYCGCCGEKLITELKPKVIDGCIGKLSIEDSENYPQGPYSDCNEADYAVHCGACNVFLENALTPEGRRNMENEIEAIADCIEMIDGDKEKSPYYHDYIAQQNAIRPLAEYYNIDLNNPRPNIMYCVSVYLVDRAFGGHEEGGWWYDYGNPVLEIGLPTPKFTSDRRQARAWQIEMKAELDNGINKGRRDIGSVLSDGVYRAVLDEGYPKSYPETKPHYE